jgi:4-carboxymuconolactone decarboxylase
MKATRIAPLEPPYGDGVAEQLAKWMPPNSGLDPLKLFRTLYVNGDLAGRMRPLGAGILGHGKVAPRDRELMILRTCALNGAEYEWGVHVTAFAQAVGLSDADVHATVDGGDDVVIRLADELHATTDVSDELYAELEQRWSPEQILELIITAGWYRLLSGIINATGLELEPWAARFPVSASA